MGKSREGRRRNERIQKIIEVKEYHSRGCKNKTAKMVWSCATHERRKTAKTDTIVDFKRKDKKRKTQEKLNKRNKQRNKGEVSGRRTLEG